MATRLNLSMAICDFIWCNRGWRNVTVSRSLFMKRNEADSQRSGWS